MKYLWRITPGRDGCRKGAGLLGRDYKKCPGQICYHKIEGVVYNFSPDKDDGPVPFCNYYYYIGNDGKRYLWKILRI